MELKGETKIELTDGTNRQKYKTELIDEETNTWDYKMELKDEMN